MYIIINQLELYKFVDILGSHPVLTVFFILYPASICLLKTLTTSWISVDTRGFNF